MKLFDIFKKKQAPVEKNLGGVPTGYVILKNGIGEYKWENIKNKRGSADRSYEMFKSYDEALEDLLEWVERGKRARLRDEWVKLDKKS